MDLAHEFNVSYEQLERVSSLARSTTTFLAGLYGMNFDIMPELHLEYGYYGLLSVMMTVAISLLAIFRIKRVVNVQLTSN
jgi:Mg2+ and Co2+ transporter CorA